MKRAVILFAEGYETVEALLVVDLLRRGGVEVTMASITEDEFVRSLDRNAGKGASRVYCRV